MRVDTIEDETDYIQFG
jgi:hypothetical protein